MKVKEILTEAAGTVTLAGVKFKKESSKSGVSYIIPDQEDNFFMRNEPGVVGEQCKLIESLIGNDVKIKRSGKSIGNGGLSFEEAHTNGHFGGEVFSIWFGNPNTEAEKEMRKSGGPRVNSVNRINFNFHKSVKDEKLAEKIITALIKNFKYTP